jgi:uncharacterized protein (DUF2164 family)
MNSSDPPLRVRLSDDRRRQVIKALQNYFAEQFDEELSDFRARGLLDVVIAELGPPVYNQGVRDACAHIQEKLVDLEGEVYEPESPPR